MKKPLIALVFFLFWGGCTLTIFGLTKVIGKEQTEINRTDVFSVIKDSYEAQYSIRDKNMSSQKIYDYLSPYFTNNFVQVFLDENNDGAKNSSNHLFTRKPPLTFTKDTKLVYDEIHNILYVYEKKDKSYEIIELQKENSYWKQAGYHSSSTLLTEIQNLENEN
ncbi:DUF3993 domain-containing protein [Bacillus paramycoides]|uniref:DUF3993 domain-containing protein n=1 Tax=Bacillus paramycoides TaxID=2026194 RepID=UPI0015B838CD|nr:DUF3993 domain-containing protein [Bacillus paramycoides]NWK68985.1 DUF3993 domain-containing protein [Bacillus paramycoides]